VETLLVFGCWLLVAVSILAFKHSRIKSKGGAEDENGDSAAKFAKIRPMRVEMFLGF